jgi:non-heme chloroperoxidase
MIAQRVALDYPHRVSRLVLMGSPTTLLNNEVVMEAGEQIRALEDPISPGFVRAFHMSTIHHPVPEEFLSTALSETLKVPARVWRGYMEGVVLRVDDTTRLGEIEAPTLILWGERDAILGREEQEWRSGAIPDARLKVYPDTGHAVAFERPVWVVRDLEMFGFPRLQGLVAEHGEDEGPLGDFLMEELHFFVGEAGSRRTTSPSLRCGALHL